jgi:hypothetical protein
MLSLRAGCEDGDRRACVRLGIIIGENRERRAAWRREHPEVFFYERCPRCSRFRGPLTSRGGAMRLRQVDLSAAKRHRPLLQQLRVQDLPLGRLRADAHEHPPSAPITERPTDLLFLFCSPYREVPPGTSAVPFVFYLEEGTERIKSCGSKHL